MNEMVERVAIALFVASDLKHADHSTPEKSWRDSPRYHAEFTGKARVAIEAMREPSDDLLRSADIDNDKSGAPCVTDWKQFRQQLNALIDAALK